VTELDGGGKA